MDFRDWAESFEVRVPEFRLPGTSMSICNAILPHDEQNCIVTAARAEFAGASYDAETHRIAAGYGRLGGAR